MKITTDLWFASYLCAAGVELLGYEKVNGRKVQFKFDLTEEEWGKLRVTYFNSDISKYRQAQERLKDLLY